jgi:hypothetical protein
MRNKKCIIKPSKAIEVTYRSGQTDSFDSIDDAIDMVEQWINNPDSRYFDDESEKVTLRKELKDLLEYKRKFLLK